MIEEFNIPGTCLSRCEMTNVIVMENSDGHTSYTSLLLNVEIY